jgi:hypothetical protein
MHASFVYRFFAVVCFCLLVGSVLFPFATRLVFIVSLPPSPQPFDAIKDYFWSFMNLHEYLADNFQRQDSYVTVDKSWSIFSDYWINSAHYVVNGNRIIHPSSVLVLAFILQVACLLLGIFIVFSERRIRKSMLLLSMMVVLDILYVWVAHAFSQKAPTELYVGFWLSVLSTIFGLVLMIPFNRSHQILKSSITFVVYAKKSNRSINPLPLNMLSPVDYGY